MKTPPIDVPVCTAYRPGYSLASHLGTNMALRLILLCSLFEFRNSSWSGSEENPKTDVCVNEDTPYRCPSMHCLSTSTQELRDHPPILCPYLKLDRKSV